MYQRLRMPYQTLLISGSKAEKAHKPGMSVADLDGPGGGVVR
jgi:hypothetical protein